MRLAGSRRRQLRNCGREYGVLTERDRLARVAVRVWVCRGCTPRSPEPGSASPTEKRKTRGTPYGARSTSGARFGGEVGTCLLHRLRHRGFASAAARHTNRLAESRSSATAARNRDTRTRRIRQRTDGLTFALIWIRYFLCKRPPVRIERGAAFGSRNPPLLSAVARGN